MSITSFLAFLVFCGMTESDIEEKKRAHMLESPEGEWGNWRSQTPEATRARSLCSTVVLMNRRRAITEHCTCPRSRPGEQLHIRQHMPINSSVPKKTIPGLSRALKMHFSVSRVLKDLYTPCRRQFNALLGIRSEHSLPGAKWLHPSVNECIEPRQRSLRVSSPLRWHSSSSHTNVRAVLTMPLCCLSSWVVITFSLVCNVPGDHPSQQDCDQNWVFLDCH